MITMLMIALGAAVGAPARYLTDYLAQARSKTAFPLGTFAVNALACLILGTVTAASRHLDPNVVSLIGPGFCASLSTYSTFSYETLRLFENGERRTALTYTALSVVVGIGFAALGYTIG